MNAPSTEISLGVKELKLPQDTLDEMMRVARNWSLSRCVIFHPDRHVEDENGNWLPAPIEGIVPKAIQVRVKDYMYYQFIKMTLWGEYLE